ncbi:D-Ala-D-Ala carboxypeptidase family metallohydrolase [Rhizobium pusense]|uniref:D-Ala-D-Ala carboxypeptidase family metallohydrolase n=1 Tax=Agrobacterium pusense TaxID=648995 RepID=UPI00244D51FD|nr:D-Ala-D-Ala carboxypeptidase family metallohydrolase [Agrobacterium pusense]MDH2088775.1 D-Ala-D-Ala carboxypeptidase family metallohydrolase [Agrobacterium pusense]
MKTVEGAKGRVSCRRLVIAVSLLGLSGCVSAVTDEEMAATAKKPEVAGQQKQQMAATAAPAAGAQQGHYVDPAVASAAGATTAPAQHQAAGGPAQGYGAAADIAGLTTQPTGISAGTSSIYSTASAVPSPAATAPGAAAAGVPSQKITPALSSVYSAPVQVAQPQPVSAPVAVPSAPQVPEQHSENRQPAAVPVPQTASEQLASVQPATSAAMGDEKQEGEGKGVTLAAFFAGAAKKRLPKMIESGSAGGTQVAALPGAADKTMGIALSGRSMMSDEFDDAHLDEEDDEPTGLMKLASLSGLTRVAPNGLFLQTDRVEVGCFKPELISMIKDVERHYNSPAIVTSGYRPPKGIRQGSKHYTCDAADIQIKGVSKWELATYLRSLPNRGGVGTYCHTESVHMDTGEPRDWNWRCRRTAVRK